MYLLKPVYFCSMTIEELYKIFLQHPCVETDTRKIKQGDIFFALKGPNFNGNKYVPAAFEAGAAFCVCDETSEVLDNRIIYVKDVLDTLQQLAKYHRQQFTIPFVAITGSNGKTTTKELVHEVLSTTFKCYTTKGNLNNHIGVPLTLLAIKKDAEIAVIEMGANHQKEIEGYCLYTLPTHGLITNCGKAHLEGFGGEEGVKKGKGELYSYIAQTSGVIFINTDYAYLKEMSLAIPNKISYGSVDGTYTGVAKENNDLLEVKITKGAEIDVIQTNLAGNYNLPNVMSAVCIGKFFGVDNKKIKIALENYVPTNSRSQMIQKGSNTILLDAYNANPSSMKAAIENFATMKGEKKVIILGAMMELGTASLAEHKAIIELLSQFNWHAVVVAGEFYTDLPEGILHFQNATETAEWYEQQQFKDATILIKGSRGMAMEKVLD
ncbi:MAG: UDP-N-acetylmuramoyl-tripeptide--D-alanyl-D-alanine ligase [Ferruginibacter sp.]